jgi:hypothetical protein
LTFIVFIIMTSINTKSSTKRKHEDISTFLFPPATEPSDLVEYSLIKSSRYETCECPECPKLDEMDKSIEKLVIRMDFVEGYNRYPFPLDIFEDFKEASDFQVYDPHFEIEFQKFMEDVSFI